MKENRSLMKSLVACGVALAMVSTLAAQTAMDGTAKVIRVKGLARYMAPGGAWQPLKTGLVLKPGTLVQTGKDGGSFVDLVLNDSSAGNLRPVMYNASPSTSSSGSSYQPSSAQNVVRVWSDTALGIDKLTTMQTGADQVTETQLDLRQGRISGSVKKMSAASKYEIKLPNGVAGIRGTAYDITADGVVKVYEGSIVLAIVKTDANGNTVLDANGNPVVTTQVVTGGKQYDARTNTFSDISAADMNNYKDKLVVPMYSTTQTPTVVIADHTIYTSLSSTQGQNGQGQNNNNQGQNNNSQH